jgi:drug/metabolite transporter (DMT)-like permease
MFMGSALVSTVFSAFFLKLQNNQFSDELPYVHPFMQCTLMYIGQLLCFYIDCIIEKLSPSKQEYDFNGKAKLPAPLYMFAFPSLFNGLGSVCFTIGLAFCALSISQIMGGVLIISSSIFSVIILHKKMARHSLFSIVLIFIGILVSGFATLFYSGNQTHGNKTTLAGILLIFVANVLWSFIYIIGELIFVKYQVSPLYAIGVEGIVGLLCFLPLLLMFQFIHCTPNYLDSTHTSGLCIYGVIEDSARAISQIAHNKVLLFTSIGYSLIVSLVSYSLSGVIKYGSAIHSCIIGSVKTVTLWTISTIFFGEAFNWLELLGYVIFILLGTLIYNEIIVVPCFGLNRSLEKSKILKLEESDKSN